MDQIKALEQQKIQTDLQQSVNVCRELELRIAGLRNEVCQQFMPIAKQREKLEEIKKLQKELNKESKISENLRRKLNQKSLNL